MGRHVVCQVFELPPGSRIIVELEGRSLGVFNINRAFFALRNVCPHQGAPLCLGTVKGMMAASAPPPVPQLRASETGSESQSVPVSESFISTPYSVVFS
jgi:hypothetical protein